MNTNPPQDSCIWDRTNIGENYPTVISPLTFSFIKNAYSQVYQAFLRLIGIREPIVVSNQHVFDNLLGYINGYVYYHLGRWYELLELLPGYQFNKEFFETMLDPAEKRPPLTKQSLFKNIWNNRRVAWSLASKILFIQPLHRKFTTKFQELSSTFQQQDLKQKTTGELLSYYQALSHEFFSIWSITILNDFKTMISIGLLTKLADSQKIGVANLLENTATIKTTSRSIAPLKALRILANHVNQNPITKKLFENDPNEVLARLSQPEHARIKGGIDTYLQDFGTRSLNELTLESATFQEKPQLLIKIIQDYTHYPAPALYQKTPTSITTHTPWHIKFILQLLTNHTVSAYQQREKYRLDRAIVFNYARQIFLELGIRLHQHNLLDDRGDVFYLYQDELFNYFNHHTLPTNLKLLVTARKLQLTEYAQTSPLRRIRTDDLGKMQPSATINSTNQPQRLKQFSGKTTSLATAITGEILIMEDLDLDQPYADKIIVTQATDPGWTLIFPLIKGIVIEKGGLLSHASVVAREIGIPCIIVPNATKLLHTGDWIFFDTEHSTITLQ